MSLRTAAVTGASGYVGSRIVQHLRRAGVPVLELCRNAGALRRAGASGRFFTLERGAGPELLAGVDWLVHCAWDFRPTRWQRIREVNVEGSERLFRAAASAGVARTVAISTLSSFRGCRSLYGRAKLEVEEQAARLGAAVVRPGLVFGAGAGGMLGTLARLAERLPVVPLVGSGDQILYLAHADDLCRLVHCLLERDAAPPPAPVAAASERGLPLREILEILGAARGRRVRTLPVPWRLVHAGIRAVELTGLPLPVRSDSVVSLVHQDPAPDFGPARQLRASFRDFDVRALEA